MCQFWTYHSALVDLLGYCQAETKAAWFLLVTEPWVVHAWPEVGPATKNMLKTKKRNPPQLVKQFCSQGLFYKQEILLSEIGGNSDNNTLSSWQYQRYWVAASLNYYTHPSEMEEFVPDAIIIFTGKK